MSVVLLFNLVALSIAITVFIVALYHDHAEVAMCSFLTIFLVGIVGLLIGCGGTWRQEFTYYEVESVLA